MIALFNLKGRLSRTSIRLLLVVSALLVLGLVMVYSASYGYSFFESSATRDNPSAYLRSQLLSVLVGFIGMICLSFVDYRIYRKYAIPVLAITFATLVPSILLGNRWLFNGRVQLSELGRLLATLYLAIWLAGKGQEIRNLKLGFLPFDLLVGAFTGMIVLQSDLSTAALIFVTAMAMVFVAGADIRQLIPTILITVPLVLGLALLQNHGDRILQWFSTSVEDVSRQNTQVAQCLAAINRGGFLGVGLGQSELKYVIYAAQSDGIFAIIGEELGLLGSTATIALFALWTWFGLCVAREAHDTLGRLLAIGLTMWVTLSALLHISASLNALPFNGSVLPFISSGGSSLVTVLASVGILVSIARGVNESAEKSLI
ncbi:MAG: FtsW/RodA/SpoVE family cell cycle protein [Anaerolineae bacterium]